MPSRHNRNARKINSNNSSNDHSRIYQQPTPSSRPSPDAYPSPLPDESPANSSSDDLLYRGRDFARLEPRPEFQDSGGQLLAVGHSLPQSLPTPPTHPALVDDSTVTWNLEEGDPDDIVSSRPSTTPSSKLSSTDNSAFNSTAASSAASPSSSNPVSPSLRSVALSNAAALASVSSGVGSPGTSPGPVIAPQIASSPSGKGKKKKKHARSDVLSSSPSSVVSASPPYSSSPAQAETQPREPQAQLLFETQPHRVEPRIEQPQLQLDSEVEEVKERVDEPRGNIPVIMDEEEESDLKEVSGLTGFSNLVDLNSPGVDIMDGNGTHRRDEILDNTTSGGGSGTGIAASGSGSGSRSISNSMEGTIRPSRMKRGSGHARASVPDYAAIAEAEYGLGTEGPGLFEHPSSSPSLVRGGQGQTRDVVGYESTFGMEEVLGPSVQPHSRRQTRVHEREREHGSGLSQAIGKGLWRDGDGGEEIAGGGVERAQYPQQQQHQQQVPMHRERGSPNPSLLSRPASRAVSYGHGPAAGGISSGLTSPVGPGGAPSSQGRVRAPSHASSNAISSRQNSNSSIPAVANGGPDEGDVVLWARWDESLSGKRLLFLAYHPSGLQIWDCTDLSSIAEVLNLPSLGSLNSSLSPSVSLQDLDLSKMTFEYAGIIPRPTNVGSSGDFLEFEDALWPLAGILVSPLDDDIEHDDDEHAALEQDAADVSSMLVLYSLTKHCVVKAVRLPGLAIGGGRFEVGQGTVVVSTTQPPALHILSSNTFEVLHRIPEAALSTFCHKPPIRSPSTSAPPLSHSRSASLSSASPLQQRHSFLSTTSNIVNGIYNNYNEHFNDIYHNKHNNKINTFDRNNVLLNTVDDDSFPTSPGYPYHPYQRPTLEDNNSSHSRTATAFSESSAIPPTSTSIPEPVVLPAPVFSLSSRLLAYASPIPLNTDSNVGSIHPLSANATRTRSSIALTYSSTLSDAAVSTASAVGSTLSAQLANLGGNNAGGSAALGALSGIGQMSQADLGNAALKVGGSVLSGMKSLGGLAYKGAVAAASGNNATSTSSGSGGSKGGMSAFANKFFSRSAPAASEGVRDRGYSTSSAASSGFEEVDSGKSGVVPDNPEDRSSVLPKTIPSTENGYYVTVVDLSALFDTSDSSSARSLDKKPAVIARFITSKFQPVADIWFSQDGTSVLVAPRDGQVAQAFGLRTNPVSRMTQDRPEPRSKSVHDPRPKASTGKRSSSASRSSPSNGSGRSSPVADVPPLHVYNLRRGRTPAVIESASWADDGRWVAVGTRKRTVHVFAVNPYGGKTDIRGHVEGKVRNYLEPPPLSTELSPIVRLRVARNPGPDQPQVPLAFVFLQPAPVAESSMPTNLLPPFTSPLLPPAQGHSYGSVGSTHTMMSSSPSTRSEPISPHHQQFSPGTGRPKNYQDILVFDPTDGVLSLKRLTTDVKVRSKDGVSILNTSFGNFTHVGSIGSTSRSLPGTGGAGRLSTSPSKAAAGNTVASGISQVMEGPNEIVCKESTVATWSLRRRREWSETRRELEDPSLRTVEQSVNLEDSARTAGAGKTGRVDWLARAELSTCSKMTKVLPRSLYLSHQFSFHALGEDYHALIRRYNFDIPGPKIEVRKGIEVSAYPSGTSEFFVEAGGFTARRDTRRTSASFDEPLASALAGGLDYSSPQPVLPMLPNGMPGSKPRSFKNPIPIRRMGDNAAEGLGRLRREINKVRSPQLVPTSDTSLIASVPLEFDEEDEDFMDRDGEYPDVPTARADIEHDHTISPPVSKDGSASTPESNELSSYEGTPDAFEGWVGQDQQVVDELETFDHISAVGYLDEEQEMQSQAQAQAQLQAAVKSSKKGKKGRRL